MIKCFIKGNLNIHLPRATLVLFMTLAFPVLVFAQATKVTSTDGEYSAIFPAPAERLVEPPKTVNGLTSSVEIYRAISEQQVFMTLFTRYTGGVINTQKELQMNVDNFLKGVEGKLASTKPIEYVSASRKIAGIDFTGVTSQVNFHGRFYVAGNDVWGIIYIAPIGGESSAANEQFFRSLEIR